MVPVKYLAGFVDGEAYLGLARIVRRKASPEYCIRLSIYNTYRPVLEEIRTTWGGTLFITNRKLPVWKPSFALIWTNASAGKVIRKIAPYLVVKSEQARELLRFHARIQAGRRLRDRFGRLLPLPAVEVRIREAVYLKLKRLNRRGALGRRPKPKEPRFQRRVRLSAEYVAGFIDAEGSLMIAKAPPLVGSEAHQYRARISVANTKRAVLDAIQDAYGGILANQPARNPRWKPSYQLIWTEGTIEPLLSRVKNHLRVRAAQAQILTQFIQYRRAKNRAAIGRTLAELRGGTEDFGEILHRRIKQLNRRGLAR